MGSMKVFLGKSEDRDGGRNQGSPSFFCSFLAAYFLLSAACVRNMEVVGARCVNCEKKHPWPERILLVIISIKRYAIVAFETEDAKLRFGDRKAVTYVMFPPDWRLRLLVIVVALTLSPIPSGSEQAKNIAWTTWSNRLFHKAVLERKFVLLNLESRWCEACQEMEADTYADDKVQALIRQKYIPVKVDENAMPDLANRYWNYLLPGTLVFNFDGSEIVRQQGYLAPREMASMLQAIIDDPSPGPSVKPEPAIRYSSSPSIDAAVLRDIKKSFESQYDVPAQDWAFAVQYLDPDFIEYGLAISAEGGRVNDRYLRLATSSSRQLIDPVWGGAYQSLVVPVSDDDKDHATQFQRIQFSGFLDTSGDSWNTPHYEKTASTEAQAIVIFSSAYDRWHDHSDLTAALNVAGYVHKFLQSREGAFYAGQAGFVAGAADNEDFFGRDDRARRAIGVPVVDKNIYSRENGWLIAAFCKLYLVTNDRTFLAEAEQSARWVIAHRALPGGGFSHGDYDPDGPYLVDSIEMGRAFLALYAVTHDTSWLKRAQAAVPFIEKNFVRAGEPGVVSAVSGTDPRYKPHANREENAALICFIADLAKLSGEQSHEQLAILAMRFIVTREVATANFSAPVLLAISRFAQDLNGSGSKQGTVQAVQVP